MLAHKTSPHIPLRFLADERNLMWVMQLLRDESKSIQFEAFNCFKLFALSESKRPGVLGLLVGNKEKLLKFFRDFLS